MTEEDKLFLAQPLTDIYISMETDLMKAIAEQLAFDGEISPSSEWRLRKLAEAGALTKTAVKIIASYTGIQSDMLSEAVEIAALDVINELEPAFAQMAADGLVSGAPEVPASVTAKSIVSHYRRQAATDLNLVNTVMQYKAVSSYKYLVNKMYDETKRQEALNNMGKHTLSVVTGAESRQQAVRNCIREFSRNGIPAFVDKAGREWSPEAYVNMDIRTTVSNTAHAAQDAVCDRYDVDLIEISSHMGARPKCAPYQGKVYSRKGQSGVAYDGKGDAVPYSPLSETSYGEPDGIFGINCRHKKYPFVSGASFRTYFPYDEEENAERYKAFQKQRYMERRVREASREAEMLKIAGDEQGAKDARLKAKNRRAEYRKYCSDNGLKERSDRLAVVKAKNGENVFPPSDSGGGAPAVKPAPTARKTNSSNSLTNGGASVIINEREVEFGVPYGELSLSTDLEYIYSDKYASKFSNITNNENVNNSILNCARSSIDHRNGTKYEDMYIINATTGDIMGEQLMSDCKQGVVYNESIKNAIKKSKEENIPIIALHNHPEGFPPSIDDFNKAYDNNYMIGLAVGHNGQVYQYRKPLSRIENADDIHANISLLYNGGFDVDRAYREIYDGLGIKYEILRGDE